MEQGSFEKAVKTIVEREKRFAPAGFYFLKEALDFTVSRIAREHGAGRHVSGQELLDGFKDLALEQFGPMASTLMREWGIQSGEDVGEMVFLLIEEGIFGKQESDSKEDFKGGYDFEDVFSTPFLPPSRRGTAKK